MDLPLLKQPATVMPDGIALGILLANDILGQLHFGLKELQLGLVASSR